MVVTTRFAPSPTGYLHLGHAYAAIFAANRALEVNGQFVLRIEDIDEVRSSLEFETEIFRDLSWLGVKWGSPVRRQSEHLSTYQAALEHLGDLNLLYPCFCSRKDIVREIANISHAPHGPEGFIYPGTCKNLDSLKIEELIASGAPYAMRLNMNRAISMTGTLTWRDRRKGVQVAKPNKFGDIVLARKDISTSYHLAVTVDDHIQGVSLVTRGADLFEASHIHRLLQALLGFNVPDYEHHKVIVDRKGKRFSKRDGGARLSDFRKNECKPDSVFKMLGISLGQTMP